MARPSHDREAWSELAAAEVKGHRERLIWHTPEGLEVPRSTPPRISRTSSSSTRCPASSRSCGARATMYAGRPWTIRQYAGFSTAEESNAFYRQQPRGRPDGPVGRVRPRHPPRLRQRPPARRRRRRQGRRGDRLGRGHEDPLRRHPARPDVRVDDDERRRAAGARGLHRRRPRSRASTPEQLCGTIQNDILKEFMVRNTYIYPPEPSHADRGRHHRVHGRSTCRSSTRSRSPATTCRRRARRPSRSWPSRWPTALEYVRAALAAGLDVDAFAGGSRFFFGIGMNFFMEVAKLRAARLLWCAASCSQFEPKNAELDDAAHALPDVGRVAHRAGPVQQHRPHDASRRWPRSFGGTQRCTPTASTRRSRCRPSSRRASRATPSSSSRRRPASPTWSTRWAARYYVEALTAGAGRRRRWELIDEVEAMGGMTKAVEPGMPKLRIEEAPPSARRASTGATRSSSASTSTGPTTRSRSTSARSTTPPCARARSRGSSRSAPTATTPTLSARRSTALTEAARGRRPTCWTCAIDGDAGAGHGRRDLRRAGEGVRPPPGDDPYDLGRVRRRLRPATRSWRARPSRGRGLRRGGGPPPADARRQDGPGRPRPRRQGDRDRLRRPRLRRRHRPAVPDAGGGRARQAVENDVHVVGVVAARPPATRRWCPQLIGAAPQSRAATTSSWSSAA